LHFKSIESDLSDELDCIFTALDDSRPLLSRLLTDGSVQQKKSLAVIELTNEIYQRYKAKLYKCNMLQ
jgi:hypothetical protein